MANKKKDIKADIGAVTGGGESTSPLCRKCSDVSKISVNLAREFRVRFACISPRDTFESTSPASAGGSCKQG